MYIEERFSTRDEREVRYQELQKTHKGVLRSTADEKQEQGNWQLKYCVLYLPKVISSLEELNNDRGSKAGTRTSDQV